MTGCDGCRRGGPVDHRKLPTIMRNLQPLIHAHLTPNIIVPNGNDLFLNNNQFSLFHQNIRSLNKHHDDFNNFLDYLNAEFSIIALTETWISNQALQNLNMFQRNNYHTYILSP